MAESTENLVRICLAHHGYLISQGVKIKAKSTHTEVDLVAIRPKEYKKPKKKYRDDIDNLPDKLAIEVKRWKIASNTSGLKDKFKAIYKYQRKMEKQIKKTYGRRFSFCIVLKKEKSDINAIRKLERHKVFGRKVKIISINIILNWLEDFITKTKNSYFSDETDNIKLIGKKIISEEEKAIDITLRELFADNKLRKDIEEMIKMRKLELRHE